MVRNLAQLGEAAKRHFYISHYAPYLPLEFAPQILLGRLWYPGDIYVVIRSTQMSSRLQDKGSTFISQLF